MYQNTNKFTPPLSGFFIALKGEYYVMIDLELREPFTKTKGEFPPTVMHGPIMRSVEGWKDYRLNAAKKEEKARL